tara:strand:+ start:133 stop:651 length:519 start_codon:yes stop_codon:yes gene_type:complete
MPYHKKSKSKAKRKKVSRKQVADTTRYNPLLGKGDPAVTRIMETQYGGTTVPGYMESLDALRKELATKGTGTFANVSSPPSNPLLGKGDPVVTNIMETQYGGEPVAGYTESLDALRKELATKEKDGGKKKKAKKAKRKMSGGHAKRKMSGGKDTKGGFGVQEMGGKKSPFRG